jgi:hypothetical protein
LQPTVVVNESQFPEAVHDKAHSRTSASDHFGQALLADPRKHGLRSPFLAKASERKKYTGQPLFAGIKYLVDQVLFIADIADEQIRDEQIGKCVFPVERGTGAVFFG